jgi:UDP-3-O-[3-hydroxymyristoyl] glucosamine N-acyltransferase
MSAADTLTGDPRFFARGGPFDLGRIAQVISARIIGAEQDPTLAGRQFIGVAPLQTAGPHEVSFLSNRHYAGMLAETRAGAVILQEEFASRLPPASTGLAVADSYLAWARLGALFHPAPKPVPGVHPSAIIDASAIIDPLAEIGPLAVIGAGAEIGPGTRIGPHAVIGAGVMIGANCRIGAHVVVSHAIMGARVTLHPGVKIGQDGFGFAMGAEGFVGVVQLGRVILEDDVDIGANSTVDRGSAQDTVIGKGTRIDNQVQIAHNVQLGRFCVIVAQVGISGSTIFEDHVVVAGQAGFSGHLTIGKGANIGPQAGVMSDVAAGAKMLGSPAQPVNAFFREVAMLRRLARENAKSTAGKAARGSQAKDDAATP